MTRRRDGSGPKRWRAVPGRRLARGKTHFLPTDELDDERHEEITAYLADDDGDQPSSSKGSLDNTLPGENISGMQQKTLHQHV